MSSEKVEIVKDDGIEIFGKRVKCDYLACIDGKPVACIKVCTENNEISSLEFAKAYALCRGFRYAAIFLEDHEKKIKIIKIYDLKDKKFVKNFSLDFIEPNEKFKKIAALFFECTSCKVER